MSAAQFEGRPIRLRMRRQNGALELSGFGADAVVEHPLRAVPDLHAGAARMRHQPQALQDVIDLPVDIWSREQELVRDTVHGHAQVRRQTVRPR